MAGSHISANAPVGLAAPFDDSHDRAGEPRAIPERRQSNWRKAVVAVSAGRLRPGRPWAQVMLGTAAANGFPAA